MFDVKNITLYYRWILRKTRDFLLSDKFREALVFLFFVLVSFGFWLLQTLDYTYQTEFKVPPRLKNIPKDVILTSDLPDEVKVRVEDRGTVLLNYMLGRTFFPVSFDFKDFQNGGSHVRISSSEMQKRISSQLNVSTKLISIRPDTIDFIFTKGLAKKIPVRLNGDSSISATRQYYISSVKLTPDSVIAYAPKEILDTLRMACTTPFIATNVTDTLEKRVSIDKITGVKFVPSYTDVFILTDMYSEKTVEVPVIGVNFPAGKVLRTFPSKVDVTFQVGLRHFKEVDANDFFIGVTYEDVLKTKGDKLVLNVKSAPEVVGHIRISPASVDYLIEQQSERENE